jgi:hypothetical protein
MPKPRFTTGILVSMCWLCLHISIQAQPKEAKAGTSGPSTSPGVRVRTDGAGQFRFTHVTAGRYVLGALTPGFVSPSDQQYGPQGTLITVSEGCSFSDQMLKFINPFYRVFNTTNFPAP